MLRSLRRSPGFVAIATLSMGVALGISTSVFAVMDAMTHPEPPFRDVDELVSIQFSVQFTNPPPAAEVIRNLNALTDVAQTAQWSMGGESGVAMLGGRIGTFSSVGRAGPGFFDVLGTRARLGRLFTAGDHQAGNVAVVTDMVWRRDYRNASTLDSATLQIGQRVYPIVGVLPAGTIRSLRGDVFLPDSTRTDRLTGLLVRMKPGVTVAQFQPQVKALNERITKAYAVAKDRGVRAYIGVLRPDPLAVRDFHRAMVGAAVCILLIACANVSALTLARGMVKRRDYALRLALGARPVELAREVIAEVGLLAIVGCVMGAFVTTWFVSLIGGAMPAELQWEGFIQPQWSWRVFALSFAAVIGSIAVAGGAPAWIAARTDPAGPLKEGSGGTTGRAGTRFRWLVIAELAIAMTLLMSTSLMLKSIRMMERYDFGYPNARLLNVFVGAPWREDSTTLEIEAVRRQQGLEVLRAVPGVQAAIPGGRGYWCGVRAQVVTADQGTTMDLQGTGARLGGCSYAGPRFFSTVQLSMVAGRDFEDGDLTGSGAAIIDENLARGLFGTRSAVGHTIKFGDLRSKEPWLTVVGVVRSHMLDFDRNPELGVNTAPRVYVITPPQPGRNRAGQPRGTLNLSYMVRTDANVEATSLRIQRALTSLTPSRGGAGIQPWSQNFQSQLRGEHFLALIFTALGLASLLLGAAGLFSVISYVAGQRMREFAVRIALGATQENVVKLVLREGFVMAIGGTAVGAGFGMWAAFLLWDRMWGVYPVDVEALVIAEAVLILVTMAACLVPALRASKSDPLDVMRAA